LHAQFVPVDLNIWRENATLLLIGRKTVKKVLFFTVFRNDKKSRKKCKKAISKSKIMRCDNSNKKEIKTKLNKSYILKGLAS
jgi:hypothetical protein